jgi:hypothetical protein
MVDLNDPEVTPGFADVITAAQDINDLGQITGQACTADGSVCYTFRADPVPAYHARRH